VSSNYTFLVEHFSLGTLYNEEGDKFYGSSGVMCGAYTDGVSLEFKSNFRLRYSGVRGFPQIIL
jgi:hypothetical protein